MQSLIHRECAIPCESHTLHATLVDESPRMGQRRRWGAAETVRMLRGSSRELRSKLRQQRSELSWGSATCATPRS